MNTADLDRIRRWHAEATARKAAGYTLTDGCYRDVDILLTEIERRDAELLELRDAVPEPLLTGRIIERDHGVLDLDVEPADVALDLEIGMDVAVWPEGYGPLSETQQVRLIHEIDRLNERLEWVSGHDRSGADHLREMMQHAGRADDLESIVRDLAESDPAIEGDEFQGKFCRYCDEGSGRRQTKDHDVTCDWRRAREWVNHQDEDTE